MSKHVRHIITFLSYGLAYIENQTWKNKLYQLNKGDDRISNLQLARSSSNKHKRNREYE